MAGEVSRAEFAQRIKAQYPVYANVPDDQLVTAMLEKYPVYRSQIRDDTAPLDRVQTAATRATGISAAPRRGVVDRVLGAEGLPGMAVGAVREGVSTVAQLGDLARAGWNAVAPEALDVSRPYQDPVNQRGLAPQNEWQQLGMRATQAGVTIGGGNAGLRGVAAQIPNRARAGANFQAVMGSAGKVPVDIANAGNTALRIMTMAERGGTMPKVVRDFLRRATDPHKGPIDYEELRDYATNISRLSADETRRLSPVIRRELGNLRVLINHAAEQAAESVGKGAQYRSAMREYALRSNIDETIDDLWTGLKRALPWGTVTATGTYVGNRLSDLLRD